MMSRRALLGWMLPPTEATPAPVEAPPLRGRVVPQRARLREAPAVAGPRVAVVSTFACLNAGADFCATCVERCPEPGAIRVEGRRVVVDPAVCNGCGVCVPLCPAPGGAILLMPVT